MFRLIPKWIVNDARQQIAVNSNCYKHINNIIVIIHENPFAFMGITQFIILLLLIEKWKRNTTTQEHTHTDGREKTSASNQIKIQIGLNSIESNRFDDFDLI